MTTPSPITNRVPLDSVIITDQLHTRSLRNRNDRAITRALVKLAQVMANTPENVLQCLVEAGLDLCEAGSCGISLLEEDDSHPVFRWEAVAGQYAQFLHGTLPRHSSPCGAVVDTNAIHLMRHPELHYTNLASVEPPCAEVLLIPFHISDQPVGTIWVVSHDESRNFDARDAEVMNTLSEFAAAAYKMATVISDLRDAQAALEQANRSLRGAYGDLETFAFAAGHDLREPLRNVLAYQQLLQRHLGAGTDQRALELCDISVHAALRMRNLVDALLSYSNLQSENAPMTTIALDNAVDDALANLKSLIEENDAVITRDNLPLVVGDKSQLTSLFQNLITNSIKYRQDNERPRVHVKAERQIGFWQIALSDNGIGFPQEFANQIFAPLRRLHGADLPGTGMGLAICQKIVERHGGSIRATSSPNKGSTFFFTLPII